MGIYFAGLKKWQNQDAWRKDNYPFCHYGANYRQIYLAYKKDLTDKAFAGKHKPEISLYEKALADLKKLYSKIPNTKQIFEELEKMNEKNNKHMQEYSSSKSEMTEYIKSGKTMKNIWRKRWKDNSYDNR